MNAKEKDKKLKILLPLLVVGAALVWMPNLKSTQESAAPQGASQNRLVEVKKMLIYASSNISGNKEFKSEFDQWGRNPFIVEGWERSQTVDSVEDETLEDVLMELILSGIIFNESRPSAIINNTVVGIGTKIGPYEVIQIFPGKVVLSDGVNERELTVTK